MPSSTLPAAISDPHRAATLALFLALSLILVIQRATGRARHAAFYLQYLWVLVLVFSVAELVAFAAAVWILAALSFLALREYFALAPLRIQDRWAMIGAYLSIPFMTWFIQTDWYGMFIVSIPVYAFLVIPALVALAGRDADGTVLSIGALEFGLFLFVYCAGHIGYLARLSTGKAVFLVLVVAGVDVVTDLLRGRGRRSLLWIAIAGFALSVSLALALASWAELPVTHALALGGLIPALVWIARMTVAPIESDLRIDSRHLVAGRGAILRSLRSFLFAGPVVFHYMRYFFT